MYLQSIDNHGKYLYHFTSAETALLYILPQLRLKFSSVANTNDPQENKTFGFWEIFANVETHLQPKAQNIFSNYIKENCRVLCFSQDYKVKINKTWMLIEGYKHPTMWAHYTNNNSGICLVFNKQVVEEICLSKEYHAEPVTYRKGLRFPKFKNTSVNSKTIHNYIHKHYKSLFFTKHFHWQSENEFRILQFGETQFLELSEALIGFYLGNKFDDNLEYLLDKMPKYNMAEKVMYPDGEYFTIPLSILNMSKKP
jgi:hypothetical protein